MEWECTHCGALVHEASKFCASCGKSFDRNKRSIGFWIAVAFGCVMLVGIVSGIVDNSTAPPTAGPASSVAAPEPAEPPPTKAEIRAGQRVMRKLFASRVDSYLLDSNIESITRTTGPDDTTLEIKDVLAGRVRARQISNAMNFEALKKLGFKKLHYTNGFEGELREGWTWDVK